MAGALREGIAASLVEGERTQWARPEGRVTDDAGEVILGEGGVVEAGPTVTECIWQFSVSRCRRLRLRQSRAPWGRPRWMKAPR